MLEDWLRRTFGSGIVDTVGTGIGAGIALAVVYGVIWVFRHA